MLILENIIINVILILFPILIYLFYMAYKKCLREEEKNLFLEMALFSSFFLSIYFFKIHSNKCCILLTTIPLLLSFLYKKINIAVIISIILFEFLRNIVDFPMYLLILTLLLYFILYIYAQKANKNNAFYTNGFYVITLLSTIIFIILKIHLFEIKLLSEVFLISFLFYIAVTLINSMINKANEILNLYMSLKNFEHEKQIKLSLFKISHEIKNPIAVVKGYLDMFDVNDKNKSIKYISIINQEINRTLNLLNDFMQFSNIILDKELIDVNLLLDDIKQIIKSVFDAKNINYKFEIEDNVFINADYNRLKQVIINLIKNSIEACKKNGIVKVTTYTNENNLIFIIKDNGSGMDKETLEKIQTPFYTTKRNGTGLGVSLSKEIIEAHKGKIFYSSIPRKETIAKIVLPIN